MIEMKAKKLMTFSSIYLPASVGERYNVAMVYCKQVTGRRLLKGVLLLARICVRMGQLKWRVVFLGPVVSIQPPPLSSNSYVDQYFPTL